MRLTQRKRAPPGDLVHRAFGNRTTLTHRSTGCRLLRGSSVFPRSYSRSPSYSSKSGKRSPPSRSSRSRRSPSYSRYSPSRYHPKPRADAHLPNHIPWTLLYQYLKPCPSPNPAKVGTGILAILSVQSRVATRPQYTLYSTVLSHPGALHPCLTCCVLLPLYSQPDSCPPQGLLIGSSSPINMCASTKGHMHVHTRAHAQRLPLWLMASSPHGAHGSRFFPEWVIFPSLSSLGPLAMPSLSGHS